MVNPPIISLTAVRGVQARRAEELRTILQEKPSALPFESVISCNIGNPQQLGQTPLTFYRQVSALVEYPQLMEQPIFPSDAIERAKEVLKAMGGSVGAYSHSQGIPLIRKRVAEFIEKRDGYPANPDDIFLTAGASPGVQAIMQTIISGKHVGVMIPLPQYPLYTASIALYGGSVAPYYLNESNDWSVTRMELERASREARGKNPEIEIRALVVINPGNPASQVLNEETMREIIRFCENERIVLLADEVYQENIYTAELPFHSFKKVLCSMGAQYDTVELISFHSISKGLIGECGRRGGYYECVNIDQSIKDVLYKLASVSLCPPIQGQVMVELMVNPPKPDGPSFALFEKERDLIFCSLKRRAVKLADAFNRMEGIRCNVAQGSLYLFPSITIPGKAIEAAKAQKVTPCSLYTM